MLLGLRMVTPDARVLDIDPEERVRAMVPDGSFTQDAGARHRHMGCFRMNGWMCHVSSPQSIGPKSSSTSGSEARFPSMAHRSVRKTGYTFTHDALEAACLLYPSCR